MQKSAERQAGAPRALKSWPAQLCEPLDWLRGHALRLVCGLIGRQALRALFLDKELRVALVGSLSVIWALFLSLRCPLLLLVLSPLALGVPHLLADVRYLVAQPGYHRRMRLALPVGGALLLAALGMGMPAGLFAVLATLLLADGTARPQGVFWRRALGISLVLLLLGLGLLSNWYWLELGLAHVHNFVAVLLFALWRRRKGTLHHLPLWLFAGGVLVLLSGTLPLSTNALVGFEGQAGLFVEDQQALLAPLLPPPYGTRLLLLFAFAQAVHYTVWLRLIPDEARKRPAPRPFAASLQALQRDVGETLLGLALFIAGALALWALLDLGGARTGYFQLALFHGYLELCVLALWWIEGQREQECR